MLKIRFVFVILTMICSGLGYPYGVNISDIKATSAVLHWKTTELKVEEFLIQCVGTQFYAIARDGRVHNTEMHVRSQFVPEGLEGVRIGDLRPNYNYTCVVQETLPEGAQVYNGILSRPVTFTSDYASPMAPKAPVIVKQDGITQVNLHKSPSTKFGPISGYRVQFHVIEDSFLGDVPVIDREFTDPFGKFSPVTVEYAQTSPKAISFQAAYTGNNLPSYIQINSDLMQGALKNGALYRIVTVAFTKCRDGTIAFTPSVPSDSFIAVGVDKFISQGRFLRDVRSEQLKIGIVAGLVVPLVCLLYMCCIGSLLLCRERHLESLNATEEQPKSCSQRLAHFLKMKMLVPLLAIQWCCPCLCGPRKCCGDYERVDQDDAKTNVKTGISEVDNYSMPRWSTADTRPSQFAFNPPPNDQPSSKADRASQFAFNPPKDQPNTSQFAANPPNDQPSSKADRASQFAFNPPNDQLSMARRNKAPRKQIPAPSRPLSMPEVRRSPPPQLVAVEPYDPRLIQVEGFQTRKKIEESTSDEDSNYSKAPDLSSKSSPILHKESSLPAHNLAYIHPLPTPIQGEFEDPRFPPYQPASKVTYMTPTYHQQQQQRYPSQKQLYNVPSGYQPPPTRQSSHKSIRQPSQRSILRSGQKSAPQPPQRAKSNHPSSTVIGTHHSSPTGTIYTSPRSQAKSQTSPPAPPIIPHRMMAHQLMSPHQSSSLHSPPRPPSRHTTTPQYIVSPVKSHHSSYPTMVSPPSRAGGQQSRPVSQHTSQHNFSQHYGRTSHKGSQGASTKSRKSSRSSRGSRNPTGVPWMTLTPASSDGGQNLSQLSPNFEPTHGAQPLQYTTSATGAFNTAEEFHSAQDTSDMHRDNSESMFLPRGYSGTSALSSGRTNSAFEVISISSSCQVGGSEHSGVLEVLH